MIDSAKWLQQELNTHLELQVKPHEVRAILKEDLGMKFRKIKKSSLHLNSRQNLILRQEWAVRFLKLWDEGKTFLNFDESWLGMSDFRRYKWQEADSTNSVPTLALVPRVSVLLAIDSTGSSYLSLTQANSNSSIMELFLRGLVKKLDA